VSRSLRRDARRGVSNRKQNELREIAKRWHTARSLYIRELSATTVLKDVFGSRYRLREARRQSGWAAVDLTVHYHQVAFLSAVEVVRSAWARTFAQVTRLVARNSGLTASERRWLLLVLRRPDLVEACLSHETVRLKAGWTNDLDQVALTYRVARMVRRYHRPSVRVRRRDWFEVDGALYRVLENRAPREFVGPWIAVTGLRRGERLYLPLAGRIPAVNLRPNTDRRPNIRIDLRQGITFHLRERVTVTPRAADRAVGVDKGYAALITVSRGDPTTADSIGIAAASKITELLEATEERRRNRRRLVAYARSVRNSRTARHISRRNLGRTRESTRRRRDRACSESLINRELDVFFAQIPDVGVIFAESLTFARKGRRRPAFNRRIGTWMKGFLQERLKYKAELNGVELQVVNAAYTSQTCPRCWFTSRYNRRADRFECAECGYTGRADAVAATNILGRGSDAAITSFMPSYVVKQILQDRWQSARIGRAWDSNERAPLFDVTADSRAGTSREQPSPDGPSLRGSNSPRDNVVSRLVS